MAAGILDMAVWLFSGDLHLQLTRLRELGRLMIGNVSGPRVLEIVGRQPRAPLAVAEATMEEGFVPEMSPVTYGNEGCAERVVGECGAG
jgi:hypothetical protein